MSEPHAMSRVLVRSLDDIRHLPLPESLKLQLAGDFEALSRIGPAPAMVVSYPRHAIAGRWTALRMVQSGARWNSRVFASSAAD